jgi:hypothetical protein
MWEIECNGVGTDFAQVWMSKMSSGCPEQDFRGTAPDEETEPWLCRFSNPAFVGILQLLRLVRHNNEELAVDVQLLSRTSSWPHGELVQLCAAPLQLWPSR